MIVEFSGVPLLYLAQLSLGPLIPVPASSAQTLCCWGSLSFLSVAQDPLSPAVPPWRTPFYLPQPEVAASL